MLDASELILNDRGAIYHINMKNDELADIIITVGDPARVDKVCEHFNSIRASAEHREFRWKTGIYSEKEITVISTGIGPDNIDIVLNELDAVANIDFETREVNKEHRKLKIIRLGTTGSLSLDLPVDAMVVSAMAIGLDNLMYFYDYSSNAAEKQLTSMLENLPSLAKGRVYPYAFQASENLVEHFDESWIKGITVTAPGFYGPQGRKLRAHLSMPMLVDEISEMETGMDYKITNFEMETSAILGLSAILGHEATAVSVAVAQRKTKEFTKDGDHAVENMIQKCLPIIANF